MSRFQGRERARGETFIVFRRRRGGARFGREEIWEAEPANLNSKYQISYRLIFVPVSPDLTSRHVSKVRSMLEVGRGRMRRRMRRIFRSLISPPRHWPDVDEARRRYSARGWPLSKEHPSTQFDETQGDFHAFACNHSSGSNLFLNECLPAMI